MINKIFGLIGMLWGGTVLVNELLNETHHGSQAYQSGQSGALIFAGLMFIAGAYCFFKKQK